MLTQLQNIKFSDIPSGMIMGDNRELCSSSNYKQQLYADYEVCGEALSVDPRLLLVNLERRTAMHWRSTILRKLKLRVYGNIENELLSSRGNPTSGNDVPASNYLRRSRVV